MNGRSQHHSGGGACRAARTHVRAGRARPAAHAAQDARPAATRRGAHLVRRAVDTHQQEPARGAAACTEHDEHGQAGDAPAAVLPAAPPGRHPHASYGSIAEYVNVSGVARQTHFFFVGMFVGMGVRTNQKWHKCNLRDPCICEK